jgi:hypothetical protein
MLQTVRHSATTQPDSPKSLCPTPKIGLPKNWVEIRVEQQTTIYGVEGRKNRACEAEVLVGWRGGVRSRQFDWKAGEERVGGVAQCERAGGRVGVQTEKAVGKYSKAFRLNLNVTFYARSAMHDLVSWYGCLQQLPWLGLCFMPGVAVL